MNHFILSKLYRYIIKTLFYLLIFDTMQKYLTKRAQNDSITKNDRLIQPNEPNVFRKRTLYFETMAMRKSTRLLEELTNLLSFFILSVPAYTGMLLCVSSLVMPRKKMKERENNLLFLTVLDMRNKYRHTYTIQDIPLIAIERERT